MEQGDHAQTPSKATQPRQLVDQLTRETLQPPHGDVATKYGVYRAKDGISERAIFVVGKDGKISWSKVYDIPQQPDNDDVFAALKS